MMLYKAGQKLAKVEQNDSKFEITIHFFTLYFFLMCAISLLAVSIFFFPNVPVYGKIGAILLGIIALIYIVINTIAVFEMLKTIFERTK